MIDRAGAFTRLVALLLVAASAQAWLVAQKRPAADPRLAIMTAEDRRMVLPPNLRTPAIDALRASLADDARMIVELTRSADPQVRASAVRALGRYESREFTAAILQFVPFGTGMTAAAAPALAQSLRGDPLAVDLRGDQLEGAIDTLLMAGEESLRAEGNLRFSALSEIGAALAHLPYTSPAQVERVDAFLFRALRRLEGFQLERRMLTSELAYALEALARRNLKLASLSESTLDLLRQVTLNPFNYGNVGSTNALAALIASRGVDEATLRSALRRGSNASELRRLLVLSLAGAGSPITGDERTRALESFLNDIALIVRIEAVRAWARVESATNGCARLLEAGRDREIPVALTAIDLLWDACGSDQNVTDWLTAEVRTPPDTDAWHREAHALVSLARRAPDRAALAFPGFLKHGRWQVRMYAATAAAFVGDVPALERLAADDHPNVREATLPRLRALRGAASDPLFVAALRTSDYQLLRTAAISLKGATPTPELATALLDALKRVTAEEKETSRDTRLALLERLDELGSADQAGQLVALLQDFDVQVAQAAAALLQKWTGKPQEIAPRLLPRPAPPQRAELEELRGSEIELALGNGQILTMRLHVNEAPLTAVRFMRLARNGYFNGLTFHRVVPNFVIQGGSPGANEYAGDGPFGRDEIGTQTNRRGSVGLSTRGRDTGDAQFYVNLVGNARLDFDYTVFGTVREHDVLDRILEGETIRSITISKPGTRK